MFTEAKNHNKYIKIIVKIGNIIIYYKNTHFVSYVDIGYKKIFVRAGM